MYLIARVSDTANPTHRNSGSDTVRDGAKIVESTEQFYL